MEHKVQATKDDSGIVWLFPGMIACIVLIVWLLPGKSQSTLSPRQLTLRSTFNEILAPLGASYEGRSCTSSFKSRIYYSCQVNDLSPSAMAWQLESQGWTAVSTERFEFFRYRKSEMIAVVETGSSSGSGLFLTVKDARR